MILSCIVRINRKLSFHLGINAAINVLRGSKEQRILDYKLNELSTYGIAKDIDAEKLHDVANYLIKNSYIIVSDGQYPSVDISEKAMSILKGREDVFVFLRKQIPKKPESADRAKSVYTDSSDAADSELIERLKAVRLELSIKEHVPAYIIFSNATLSDMALKEPVDMEEFLAVSGVGKTKAKKYGEVFIKAIAEYISKR